MVKPRSIPGDVAAAEALRRAAGRCARCEQPRHALIAVEVGGRFEVHCLDRAGCKRRLRAALAREGADSCR